MNTRSKWLIAILVLVLGGLPLVARAEAPLADKLPAGVLAYVGLAGKIPAAEKTNLARLMKEPAVQEVLKALDKALQANVPPGERAKATQALSLVAQLFQKPMAIALLDVAGQSPVSLCVLADLGADKGAFDNQLTQLLGDLNIQLQPAQAGGKSYNMVSLGPVTLSMGYLGNVLFLHVGSQLEKVLAVTPETSLKADPDFARKFAKVDGENVQFALYADVVKLTEAVKKIVPMDEQVGKIAQALGVSKVTAFAATMRIDAPGYLSRAMVFSPAPHQGLLMLFAGSPITSADLEGLGATAELVGVAKLSPADVYREVRSVAKQIDPKAEDALDGWQATFKMTTGVSLVGDILPSLGDTWVLSSDSAQGGLITGTLLTVSLKDQAKFADAIAKLEAFAQKQLQGEQAKADRPVRRRGPAIQVTKAGTTEIHYVTKVGNDVFPIAPAWAVHEGKFYVALWPQVIAAAVDPACAPADRKPLADLPAFARLRSKLSDKPVMMGYANWPRLVREVYPFALVGWTIVSNMRDIPLPLRPDWLPPLAVLESYLGPQMDVVSASDDGILFESASSLPAGGPMMSAAVVGMGTAIALPALNNARMHAKQAMCANNVMQITKGIILYRAENRDECPKDLAAVGKYLGGAPAMMKCPTANSARACDYFYCPPADEAKASTTVMICDFKGNHPDGSRNVAFVDGHVQRMTEADFQAALATPENAKFAAALAKAEGNAKE